LAEPAVHLLTHPTPATLAMSVDTAFQRFVRRDPPAAVARMHRWGGGYKTSGNAFDRFPPAWREQMLELGHARATLREMDQMTRPYPSRAAICSIKCPVTIIEGDLSDPAFGKANAFVMRQLPQAQLVSLPGAAHMLHFDQPERWVDLVVQATEAGQSGSKRVAA
jgi:pimeloyl-ACP methyl ester carboxylesterase